MMSQQEFGKLRLFHYPWCSLLFFFPRFWLQYFIFLSFLESFPVRYWFISVCLYVCIFVCLSFSINAPPPLLPLFECFFECFYFLFLFSCFINHVSSRKKVIDIIIITYFLTFNFGLICNMHRFHRLIKVLELITVACNGKVKIEVLCWKLSWWIKNPPLQLQKFSSSTLQLLASRLEWSLS